MMTCLPLQTLDPYTCLRPAACLILMLPSNTISTFEWRCSNHTKLVCIWALLALSPNTAQMLLVFFKVSSYPTSLSVLCGSYQLWFFSGAHDTAGSGLLWSVQWNESTGADRPSSDNAQRLRWKEECTDDKGYLWHWWLRLLDRKGKQSVSQRRIVKSSGFW